MVIVVIVVFMTSMSVRSQEEGEGLPPMARDLHEEGEGLPPRASSISCSLVPRPPQAFIACSMKSGEKRFSYCKR